MVDITRHEALEKGYKDALPLFKYIQFRLERDFNNAIKTYELSEKVFISTRIKSINSIINKIYSLKLKAEHGDFLDVVTNLENGLTDIIGVRVISLDENGILDFLHYLRTCDAYKRVDLRGYFFKEKSVFSNDLLDIACQRDGFVEVSLKEKQNKKSLHREYEGLHAIVNLDHPVDVSFDSIFEERTHNNRSPWEKMQLDFINKMRNDLDRQSSKFICSLPIEVQLHTQNSYTYSMTQRPFYEVLKTAHHDETIPDIEIINSSLSSLKLGTRLVATQQHQASVVRSGGPRASSPLVDKTYFSILPEYKIHLEEEMYHRLEELNSLTAKAINSEITGSTYTTKVDSITYVLENRFNGLPFLLFPHKGLTEAALSQPEGDNLLVEHWLLNRVFLSSTAVAISFSNDNVGKTISDWWQAKSATQNQNFFPPNELALRIYKELVAKDHAMAAELNENDVRKAILSDPVPSYRASQLQHHSGRYNQSNRLKDLCLSRLDAYENLRKPLQPDSGDFDISAKHVPSELKIVGDKVENTILSGFKENSRSGPDGEKLDKAWALLSTYRSDAIENLDKPSQTKSVLSRRLLDIELMVLLLYSYRSDVSPDQYLMLGEYRNEHLNQRWAHIPSGEKVKTLRRSIYQLAIDSYDVNLDSFRNNLDHIAKEVDLAKLPEEKKKLYKLLTLIIINGSDFGDFPSNTLPTNPDGDSGNRLLRSIYLSKINSKEKYIASKSNIQEVSDSLSFKKRELIDTASSALNFSTAIVRFFTL